MKQLLIVAIGCLPLIWLTASNLREWRRIANGPPVVTERPALDLDGVQLRADKAAQEASGAARFILSVEPIEPFTEPLLDLPVIGRESLKVFGDSWQQYCQAYKAVRRITQIYSGGGLPDEHLENSELGAFLDSKSFDGLSAGQSIEKWCQDRRKAISNKEHTVAALEAVRSEFSKGNYEATLKRLKELPNGSLVDAEKLEMKGIQRESEFKQFWKDFPAAPVPSLLADVQRRATKLEDRLKNSPSLLDEKDNVVESRKSFINGRRKELSDLQCRIKVDELFANPPEQFTQLVHECYRILEDEPLTQPRLHDSLRKWIEERLTAKTAPKYDRDEKEAWQSDGTHRRGVFRECSGFNGLPKDQQYYKYWKNPVNFRNGKTFNNEVYVKDLSELPNEMLELRLCRAFNEKRIEVLKSPDPKKKSDDSKGQWRKFGMACEEMDMQITDYYSKVSLDKEEISFKDEAQLAEEIVKEWAKAEAILKPTR